MLHADKWARALESKSRTLCKHDCTLTLYRSIEPYLNCKKLYSLMANLCTSVHYAPWQFEARIFLDSYRLHSQHRVTTYIYIQYHRFGMLSTSSFSTFFISVKIYVLPEKREAWCQKSRDRLIHTKGGGRVKIECRQAKVWQSSGH